MVNNISQQNWTIPLSYQNGSIYSPAYQMGDFHSSTIFTANQMNKTQQKENKSHKILWGALILGAAGIATALILKKTSANNELAKYKKEVEGLYNGTWENVTKHFDKNLKIEKPQLKVIKDKNDTNLATYMHSDNSITYNLYNVNKLKSYEYVVYKGDLVQSRSKFPLHTLEDIEKLKKEGHIDDTWTIKKLNEKEKELYLKFTLLHEQRHCLQGHLILNDSNYGAKFLLEEEAKAIKVNHPNLSEADAMEKAKKNSPYLVNFKPNGNHSNLKLSSPVTYDGKPIYFTTKNFAQNTAEYTSKDAQKYKMNSLEIDANIFASLLLNSKENLVGCDEKIAQIITRTSQIEAFDNLEKFMEIQKR